MISGDKGNNNPEQFVGLMDPHIAVHGSFSLMVNYHAIGECDLVLSVCLVGDAVGLMRGFDLFLMIICCL